MKSFSGVSSEFSTGDWALEFSTGDLVTGFSIGGLISGDSTTVGSDIMIETGGAFGITGLLGSEMLDDDGGDDDDDDDDDDDTSKVMKQLIQWRQIGRWFTCFGMHTVHTFNNICDDENNLREEIFARKISMDFVVSSLLNFKFLQ